MNYVSKDKAEREGKEAFQAKAGMYNGSKAWKSSAGVGTANSLVLVEYRVAASSVSQQARNSVARHSAEGSDVATTVALGFKPDSFWHTPFPFHGRNALLISPTYL